MSGEISASARNIFLISYNIYCCCWTFQLNHEVLNVIHYNSIMRTNLERSQLYSENIIIINVLKKETKLGHKKQELPSVYI